MSKINVRTRLGILLSTLVLLAGGAALSVTAASAAAPAPAAAVAAAPASGSIVMLPPARIADSRAWSNLRTFNAYESEDMQVQGHGGIPAFPTRTAGVILNVTVVPVQTWYSPGGWLTLWASGGPRPEVSQVSFDYYNTSSEVIVQPSDDGSLRIFNGSPGYIDVLVDVEGYIAA